MVVREETTVDLTSDPEEEELSTVVPAVPRYDASARAGVEEFVVHARPTESSSKSSGRQSVAVLRARRKG